MKRLMFFFFSLLLIGCVETTTVPDQPVPTSPSPSITIAPATEVPEPSPTSAPPSITIAPATEALKSSQLSIRSNPPGAVVEVGIQAVDGALTPGTGRMVGQTPLTVELLPSDISISGVFKDIVCTLQLEGYAFAFVYVGLEEGKLEPGRTYFIEHELTKIDDLFENP